MWRPANNLTLIVARYADVEIDAGFMPKREAVEILRLVRAAAHLAQDDGKFITLLTYLSDTILVDFELDTQAIHHGLRDQFREAFAVTGNLFDEP